MERIILFRGKGKFVHRWYCGCLIIEDDHCYLQLGNTKERIEVIPETVGEYTGVSDCDGTLIFEGDIITNGYWEKVVKWGFPGWVIVDKYDQNTLGSCYLDHPFRFNTMIGILGNIHDNPEITLKEVKEWRHLHESAQRLYKE